jgi:hypothetical protein
MITELQGIKRIVSHMMLLIYLFVPQTTLMTQPKFGIELTGLAETGKS